MPVSFDITEFQKQLEAMGGPASTAHFVVTFNLPASIATATDNKRMSMLCEATQLPGVSINTDSTASPYGYGPAYKMPWGVNFTDIGMVFIGDAHGRAHSVLTKWINAVVPFNNENFAIEGTSNLPFFVNYRESYATNVTIQALSTRNKSIMTYTLWQAYPVYLAGVDGNWSNTDSVMRIPTNFNYTRWSVKYDLITDTDVSALSKRGGINSLQTNTPAALDLQNNYKALIANTGGGDLRYV